MNENVNTQVITHPLAPLVDKVGIPLFWLAAGYLLAVATRRK